MELKDGEISDLEIEFFEDDNTTFANFIESLYIEQLKFLGKKKNGIKSN